MSRAQYIRVAAIILLGLAFATIAALKHLRVEDEKSEERIEADQRQSIRQFWDTYKRASQARRDGDLDLAARLYQKAIQSKPQHEDSLYYLGNCYFDLRRYQEALDAYQRLLEANPQGSSRGYMQIGFVYACLKPSAPFDLVKSESAFRYALQLDSDSGALLNLGEIALLKGKWDEAWAFLYDFNADNVMSPASPYLLGYLLWRKGKGEDAWKWFDLAVKRHEAKKPPIRWSEEGDMKADPELRWKAMAKQSLFGEHWFKLRRYLKNSSLNPSIMESEFRLLDDFLVSLRKESHNFD